MEILGNFPSYLSKFIWLLFEAKYQEPAMVTIATTLKIKSGMFSSDKYI